MKYYIAILSCLFLFMATSCKKEKKKQIIVYDNGPTDNLKINEIQIIASHNSYHLKTDQVVFDFLKGLDSLGVLPSEYDPDDLDYEHETVESQLSDYGVRGFEFDIYNDPAGGQYYYRMGRYLAGANAASNEPELMQPGFKVIHIVDFDYNSHQLTFKKALEVLRDWSYAHPNHLPLFVNVETKLQTAADVLTFVPNLTKSIPYDASACDKMDEEIKAVFGEQLDRVITPDNVRGSYPTLKEAVLAGNWPTLKESRGKIFFIMQGAAESLYAAGRNTLQGRSMFVYSSSPNKDYSAFLILNSSKSQKSAIQQYVQQGYMVRTRTDAGTTQARTGDYSDMQAAFESGAQIISTDYYRPDARAGQPGWTDFTVRFPNNELARINPVNAASKQDLGLIRE